MREMRTKKKENKNNKMKRMQRGANNSCYEKCAFRTQERQNEKNAMKSRQQLLLEMRIEKRKGEKFASVNAYGLT
jgi:hypothetical protein